jgi:hypothetical protein
MNLKALILTGISGAAFLVLAGCDPSPASIKQANKEARETHLKWSLKTLVDVYPVANHTDPKWDESAKAALTEFAQQVSGADTNEEVTSLISNNCVAAVDEGCDDPMIRYLYTRFGMDQSQSKETFAAAFCKVASDLELSPYPSIRKYYAWCRAGNQVIFTYGYGTNIPMSVNNMGIWGHAESDLLDALGDKTLPPEEAYEASHSLLEIWKWDKDHYSSLYHSIESRLDDARSKTAPVLLLKGEAYIQMAWGARGSGYASTVTSDGWKTFTEDLSVAKKTLTKAWDRDPFDPRIPLTMLTVELGLGEGRDQMEMWFARVMKLDPNNYDACNSKLWYLEPKWYGSAEQMLNFGRECATNEDWGGHVPLILMDAHRAIQAEFTPESDKAAYWSQPVVWNDLQTSFDRFFELNPESISWYHNYAWFAYQAGQWSTFNQLLPKFGSTNYDYFGGKEAFEKMVAYSKAQARETVRKNSSQRDGN